MDNYDLSAISRDELFCLLRTAKDEIAKYTRCNEEIEMCKKHIEEEKEKKMKSGCVDFTFSVITALGFVSGFAVYSEGDGFNDPAFLLAMLLFIIGLVYHFFWFQRLKKWKKEKQNNIEKYESQLPDLEKKKKDAVNEFKALLLIPYKYRSKDALTTMLEYVEDREASDWERVTDLYKTHQHRMKMGDNASDTEECYFCSEEAMTHCIDCDKPLCTSHKYTILCKDCCKQHYNLRIAKMAGQGVVGTVKRTLKAMSWLDSLWGR